MGSNEVSTRTLLIFRGRVVAAKAELAEINGGNQHTVIEHNINRLLNAAPVYERFLLCGLRPKEHYSL